MIMIYEFSDNSLYYKHVTIVNYASSSIALAISFTSINAHNNVWHTLHRGMQKLTGENRVLILKLGGFCYNCNCMA
jgi:hypothetical protein